MLEIKTYQELKKFIEKFSYRKINLLCLISSAGLGKSSLVEDILITEDPLIFSGHTTPLRLFIRLFEKTQEEEEPIVVFDDIDLLLSNPNNVALLKQIAETKNFKVIRYSSTTPILKEYPQEFETKCKTILLLNKLKSEDENLKALLNRGLLILFKPSNDEILNYIKTWADEDGKSILAFFEKFKKFARNLNARTFVCCLEMKRSGLNWQKFAVSELEIDGKLWEISQILKKHDNDLERLKEWKNSRSSFYRFKRLYLSQNLKSKVVK